MKKNCFLITGLFFYSLFAISQTADFTSSPEIKLKGFDQRLLIGVNGDQCYFATKHIGAASVQNSFLIQSVNTKDMSLTDGYKKIKNPNRMIYWLDNPFFMNNKIMLFAHSNRKLCCAVYDPNAKTGGDFVNIADEREIKTFSRSLSLDNSKIILAYEGNSGKEDNAKYHFKIIDDKPSVLYDTVVEFPYPVDSYKNLKVTMDDNGNLLIASEIAENNKNRVYKLFSYSFKTGKLKEQDIVTTGRYLYDIHLNNGIDKNQVIVAGLYALDLPISNKPVFGPANPPTVKTRGSILAVYDKENLTPISNSEDEFDFKVSSDGGKEPIGKDREMFDDLLLRHVILNNNNTVTMVLEHLTSRIYDGGESGMVRTDEIGPIFVNNFDISGKVNWSTLVPEAQYFAKNIGFASFGLINTGKDLKFIFNGSDEIKTTSVCMISLDGTGKINRETLLDNEQAGFGIACKSYGKIDNNTFVFMGTKNRFIKMVIK